jgi:hypothetical protein
MPYIAVDRRDRFQNGIAGRQQAAHCTRKTCNPATAVHDLAREGRAEPARQPHPEDDRQAADLILERDTLPDQFLARDDERPDRMADSDFTWTGL